MNMYEDQMNCKQFLISTMAGVLVTIRITSLTEKWLPVFAHGGSSLFCQNLMCLNVCARYGSRSDSEPI